MGTGVQDGDFAVEEAFALPRGGVAESVTDDGHVVAFVQQQDGQLRFCWDGTCGAPFDALGQLRDGGPTVFASDDGQHVAYVGIRGGRAFVGRDGGEDPPIDDFTRSVPPVFGGGGKHLAYGAKIDGEFRLVIDGQPIGDGQLAPVEATFSPDGERLAYAEVRGSGHEAEFRIILDRQPGEWFIGMRNAAGALQFSPDGRRFAYYTIDARGNARWFVDGVGQRLFKDVRPLGLAQLRGIGVVDPPLLARFSPDSRRFAYFADVVEKGVAIIEDDQAGPIVKAVSGPTFGPDSRLAYGASIDGKTAALIIDDATVGTWPATSGGMPVFGPNGVLVAMGLEREEGGFLRKRRWYSVVLGDGRRSPEVEGDDAARWPAISPDGQQTAWWLKRGEHAALVIDGVPDDAPRSVESEIRYTEDGRLVYVSRTSDSKTVVIGDRPGPRVDKVRSLLRLSERFSPSFWATPPTPFRICPGSHVAWAGWIAGSVHPAFDAELGPPFDDVIGCAVDERSVTWWAQRDSIVYQIRREVA